MRIHPLMRALEERFCQINTGFGMLCERNSGGISTPHIKSNSNSPHLTSQRWTSNQMRKVIGKYLRPLVRKMP